MDPRYESELDVILRRFMTAEADAAVRLAIGSSQMAERVSAGVLGGRRQRPMLLLLAATIAMLVLLGGALAAAAGLLPWQDDERIAPPVVVVASPSATPSVTPRPSGPQPFRPRLDPYPAGSYVVNGNPHFPHVTFQLPDNWTWADSQFDELGMQTGGYAAVLYLARVDNIDTDPCHWQQTGPLKPPIGPRARDLVQAYAASPEFGTKRPQPVSRWGYGGTRIDLYAPGDLGDCDEMPALRLWVNGIRIGENAHARVESFDVEGERLVLFLIDSAETTQQQLNELDAIADSMIVEPN